MSAALRWLGGRRALVAGQGDAAQHIGQALKDAGAGVRFSAVTTGDEAAIAAELSELEAEGPFDILVHGGAPLPVAASQDIDMAAWRGGFSADIDMRFLHGAAFARRCLATGRPGGILFLLPSNQPRAGHVAAVTAVGALDNLVKSLAVEWARDGIRVNGIASHLCEVGNRGSADSWRSLGYLSAYILSDYGAYISGMVMGIDET